MTDINAKLDDLLRRAQVQVADIDLFAPPPPNEDCPICFLPYPHDQSISPHGGYHIIFQTCCGKTICGGCMFKHTLQVANGICAFCRTQMPRGANSIKGIKKHMQKQDPHAFMTMAYAYKNGDDVPRNEKKALEMFVQAANFGYPDAYQLIAEYYKEGLIVADDKSKSCAFLEVAAKKGSAVSHHRLAEFNQTRGDVGLAIQHYKVAARAGLRPSLTALMKAYKDDLLPKKELEHCLRAFQASEDEMKSKDREDYLDLVERRRGRDNQLLRLLLKKVRARTENTMQLA